MKSEFFWGNDFDEFLASLNVKEKAKVLGLIKKNRRIWYLNCYKTTMGEKIRQ